MNALVKYFKRNRYIIFLVYDKELLKRCNAIWNKINSLLKKEFNSNSVYKDKYIKTIV